MQSVGVDGEQLELSYIANETVNWYNHLGKPFDGFNGGKHTQVVYSTILLVGV